ncbi:hypothetical protein EYF80_028165 [Liparis tanakae]|uniref:Uncharacterized protein n=1 Tax=Liparis tanakae TaxID=230148 RepID=A0A4Z2H822_9TELE|nr:hypothetical protein EYF80_028165 [Liparis tanakae]
MMRRKQTETSHVSKCTPKSCESLLLPGGSTAPPTASAAKEGDNKTFAVIRAIMSQSWCDLWADPKVKETRSGFCFPASTRSIEGLPLLSRRNETQM